MFLPAVVTAEPAVEPVSLAQARAQCSIEEDCTDFDTELTIYIGAARGHVEEVTSQRLVTQTLLLRCSSWADLARLPIAPISAVTSVQYLDSEGVEQTLATTVWESVLVGLEPGIRAKINQAFPAVRPVSDAIRVTVTAGYGAADAVPMVLKQPILLLIADWFRHREDSTVQNLTEVPHGVMALLHNHRV